MVPNLDIYRATKLLVDQHGQDAPNRAAERADELLGEGDAEGAAIWRAIMAAIGSDDLTKRSTESSEGCRVPSPSRKSLFREAIPRNREPYREALWTPLMRNLTAELALDGHARK